MEVIFMSRYKTGGFKSEKQVHKKKDFSLIIVILIVVSIVLMSANTKDYPTEGKDYPVTNISAVAAGARLRLEERLLM